MDFTWLSNIFNGILSFIPRPQIIRATHGGVKWRLGKKVIKLSPGWPWYWPLTTDIEIIVTARQTYKLPKPQFIKTADNITIAVGWVLVYSINDVVKAIGQQNWDVETTINDVTQSIVACAINTKDYVEIQKNLATTVSSELTQLCKKELNKFGVLVQQVKITDFAETEVKMILGLNEQIAVED